MYKRDLVSITDYSLDELEALWTLADDIENHPRRYKSSCNNLKLATLFYEPSTRTRLSHESAMIELGGNVIGFSDAKASSASKGETVADTMKVMSCFADIIAIRHNLEGAAMVAAENSRVPVINAGDGGHSHPTQTLTDLYTIRKNFGRLDNLRIGFCGDLKYGRTVHSLIEAMLRYENVSFVMIAPDELKLPKGLKNNIIDAGAEFVETACLEDALPELDILYMTRIQRERFSDLSVYDRLAGTYILDKEKMQKAKEKMIVMHPLPRVDEISTDVDDDPRIQFFEQVMCGKIIRRALILDLIERGSEEPIRRWEDIDAEGECTNPKCITHHERGLKPKYKRSSNGSLLCAYCDCKIKNE
ncbi:MAG: aspartate carbamoyltransferase [Firmicutes bacterium]|nr:aspartate carbamoyltransferase [Bacillota bacterium]